MLCFTSHDSEGENPYLPVLEENVVVEKFGNDNSNLESLYDSISMLLTVDYPPEIFNDGFIEYIDSTDLQNVTASATVAESHDTSDVSMSNEDDAGMQSVEPAIVEKKKRCITTEQKERNKKNPVLLLPCDCKKNCFENFTEDLRRAINSTFNELSFSECRLWLDNHINETETKRRKVISENEDPTIRKFSLQFMLPNGTKEIAVCKKMFLATLGRKTDGVITELRKRKHLSELDASAPVKDSRGNLKNGALNQKDHAKIREH